MTKRQLPGGHHRLPTIQGGQNYKRMQLTCTTPRALNSPCLETGGHGDGQQVPIEDIQRAYYHQADVRSPGTQLEAYQYGEAAVEPSPSPR